MGKFIDRLKSRFQHPGILLIILAAAITFLPMVNQLGYYRDDWHVAWAGNLFGPAKIIDLHLTDRPVMGVFYSLAYTMLGDSPLSWQVYAFALRVAGALLFLWLLRMLWPAKRWQTVLMALLFILYPGFLQMPTASAYSNHLFGLAMGILSVALSILAIRQRKTWYQVVLVAGSVISGLVCFSVMEYMISLEAVRLVLLGYVMLREHPEQNWRNSVTRDNIVRLCLRWLPYLAGLAGFLAWRIFFFKSARSVTDVGSLASSYLRQPGYMLARLLVETVKGIFNALILAWGVPFYNATMNASFLDMFAAALLALLVLGIVLITARLYRIMPGNREPEPLSEVAWSRDAVSLGLVVVAINIIPIVLANRDVRLTDTFDRYTLPASLGAVMVLVGLLSRLRNPMYTIFLILIVSTSVVTHYNNAAYFRNFWNYEKQLWWQLAWRAPGFESGTVLIPALPAEYALSESYEVWGPANLVYGDPSHPMVVAGEAISSQTLLSVVTRQHFVRTVRRVEVPLDFKKSLVISLPSPTSCLQVIDGNWLELGDEESPLVRSAAKYSRIDLIDLQAGLKTPPKIIFGPEPQHGWCYYFQKASLARQRKDWDEVVSLGNEVLSQKLGPQNVLEWMPFYQGYAYTGQFDAANQIAYYMRGNQLSLRTFCAQFSPQYLAGLKHGSTDEYIIFNICPEDWRNQ